MARAVNIAFQHELINLAKLAEYFGRNNKNNDIYYSAGKNTVLLCNKNSGNLNYIVSNGSDKAELFKFIGVAKKECSSYFYIYLSHARKEVLNILTTDKKIDIFKGATFYSRPTKTVLTKNRGFEFREMVLDSQLEIVEIVKDGIVIGSMKLFYDGRDMGIYELFIEQEYRMKGFGRKMIKYAKYVAFNKYANLLVAQVEDNLFAFYKKLDFEILGKILVVKIKSLSSEE